MLLYVRINITDLLRRSILLDNRPGHLLPVPSGIIPECSEKRFVKMILGIRQGVLNGGPVQFSHGFLQLIEVFLY